MGKYHYHLSFSWKKILNIMIGILISGGWNYEDGWHHLSSVEVYSPALNTSCLLPDMTTGRYFHSQNSFLTCGGDNGVGERSCEVYSPGEGWSLEPYTLTQSRYDHTSWTLNNGSVLLLGGYYYNSDTTELVTPGVGTKPGFTLKYDS